MTDTPSEKPADSRGMAAMCVAMALLPVGDAISKLLTDVVPPFEVTQWRTLAQALFFVPIGLVMRRRLRGSILSLPALFSGALIVVVLFCLISAFQHMPIATAIAIFFIEPLLLTLLAGPFLGEVAGPRRYAAVGVGLIGALVVIRPNFAVFGPVVLLPALGALAYAANMIVLRIATRTRSAVTFQLGATFSAAGLLLAAAAVTALRGGNPATLLDGPAWAMWAVLAAGALAALTFLLLTVAFSQTEASVLAPFQYLEIVGATIVGYVVFGDFPDAMTWLGTAIILGSGIYVFHRERRTGHEPERRPSARR
ncbi:DMT family transporter [Tranquillimonas rosea]|uniref:DMT family transporter n=1 Tax=Tranquillimonas rosea TaxID=641238 RepID=UPI003BAD2055